jgi:hypothetical protein
MRLLVFGGRKFNNRPAAYAALNEIHRRTPVTAVISGKALGADRMGEDWARLHRIPVVPFRPNWEDIERAGARIRIRPDGSKYDADAGFVRNQRMIDEGKPDAALRLPGGNGTNDMTGRVLLRGILLYRLEDFVEGQI